MSSIKTRFVFRKVILLSQLRSDTDGSEISSDQFLNASISGKKVELVPPLRQGIEQEKLLEFLLVVVSSSR